MKFSISIPTIEKKENTRLIKTASECGFEGVEPMVEHPGLKEYRDLLKRKLKCHGMNMSGVRTGACFLADGIYLSANDERIRSAAVERLLEYVEFVSEFPGSLVLVGLMQGKLNSRSYKLVRSRIVDALEKAAKKSLSLGVKIALEPINRFELDYHNTVESVCELVSEIGCTSLGILVDTFHMNIEEKDIYASLRQSAPCLAHVHIADSNRRAPGEGHIDMCRFLDILKAIDYSGWVTVEADPYPSFEEMAELSSQFIKKYIQSNEC